VSGWKVAAWADDFSFYFFRSFFLMINLYVGNLPWSTTETQLKELFSQYGEVTSAKIIEDRETGRSRGFGFVEMEQGSEGAIEALNGVDLSGRNIKVNVAKPKREARF
jgi:RNA recognition motif-containing protein